MDLSRFLPTLVRSNPADGSRGVSLRPTIQLWFSVDLHSDVFDQTEIVKHLTLAEAVTGAPLTFTLLPQSADRPNYKLVQIRPTEPLEPSTDYLLLILPTLPAASGRTAGVVTTIRFRTTEPGLEIPVPLPLAPPHNARVSALPVTLRWQPWSSPPSGYQLLYRVELARDERFVDDVWYSVGDASQVVVPGAYTNRQGYYYWRVRIQLVKNATQEVTVGEWSPLVGFTLAPEGTSPLGPPEQGIVSSLDGGLDGQLREWPLMVLQLVPGDAAVRLDRRDADGYPSWEWYSVPVTLTPVDHRPSDRIIDRLAVTPNEEIRVNQLYRLRVVDTDLGTVLWEKMFYSWFTPCYSHPDAIRARMGELLPYLQMDEQDLYFLIYRKSLEANRHYLWWYFHPRFGGPPESSVRSVQVGHFFSVQRWVEAQVGIEILTRQIMRMTGALGNQQRLGDYSEDVQAAALAEMRELRRQLQRESGLWAAEFSKLYTAAASGSKSSLNPAYQRGGSHEWPSRDWRTVDHAWSDSPWRR